MPAQFIVVPPLTKIQEFFVKATGAVSFHVGVEWFSWVPVTTEDVEVFRAFIRPSHSKLINEAAAAPADGSRICAFLRQLLRPHKYKIETRGSRSVSSWMLVSTDTEITPVGKHAGTTVIW
jgi:hypothetical protein